MLEFNMFKTTLLINNYKYLKYIIKFYYLKY